MQVKYVPLLQQQKQIQVMPRHRLRFDVYLNGMLSQDRQECLVPPMVFANPMAKDHVLAVLDRLLEQNCENMIKDQIELSVKSSIKQFPNKTHRFPKQILQFSAVVIDDLKGGWTNRYATEYQLRIVLPRNNSTWLTIPIWSSDLPDVQLVISTAKMTWYRSFYQLVHGVPKTIPELLNQEGYALLQSRCEVPVLSTEELEYTHDLIKKKYHQLDLNSFVEVLFGDLAAASLGFTQNGFSPQAGLALALHQTKKQRLL